MPRPISSLLRLGLGLVWLACWSVPTNGQVPAPKALPAWGPAPLLHVKFYSPPGGRAVIYQGAAGREFTVPVTVGLRPGYIYRIRLSGFPGHPGLALCPTLEVRGTLQMPPHLSAADYPAPIVFSEDDINRVLAGSVLTKVVLLEHPEQALAEASRPAQPLEINVPPGVDPLAEARARGRLVVIVRVGERDFTPEELAQQSIPGTILLPGEKALGRPAEPPCFPWAGLPVYDPILGPRPPEEECLHDGGDVGRPAGFDGQGRLQGVDPSDTVASYTDSRGRRGLAISNRICLCVPRFVVIRSEQVPVGYETVLGPNNAQTVQAQSNLKARVPSLQVLQNEQPEGLHGRQRPSASVVLEGLGRLERLEVLNAFEIRTSLTEIVDTAGIQKLTRAQLAGVVRQMELARELGEVQGPRGVVQVQAGPQAVGRVEGVNVIAMVQETRDVTVSCHEAPLPPDRPLVLFKWADAQAAQVGDVVTMYLKYGNHGGQPINDVAVSDSLTGRLEYVAGSAKSNRDAVFTTTGNEAGSVVLHWEISGPLPPGENGIVSFQVRVR